MNKLQTVIAEMKTAGLTEEARMAELVIGSPSQADKRSSEEVTELERHLYDHFRHTAEPWEPPEESPVHTLQQFVDGYKDARDVYTGKDPENEKLMDDFLRVAARDIKGDFEYTSEDGTKVIQAIETFGL